MPSSPSQQPQPPPAKNKSGCKGTFRKRIVGIMNPSKSTPKGSSFMKSRSSYACSTIQNELTDQDKYVSSNSSTDNLLVESTTENTLPNRDGEARSLTGRGGGAGETISSVTNISVEHTDGTTASNDGNNNRVPFGPALSTTEQKTSTNENSTFSTASRTTNESTSTTSSNSGEATFTTTSSSHQRLHRQITRTSEMKTSCVKSDLSELKASFSEMKNLNFSNSIENMLDSTKAEVSIANSSSTSSIGGEPVITYPESPTPSNSTTTMLCFPGSRKNSLAAEELHCTSPGATGSTTVNNELKFEQKRSMSAASRTKMITEQFKSEESMHKQMMASAALQAGNALEKSLDTKHEQRSSTLENISHQQSQNVSNSTMKLASDTFSAGKMQKAALQQRQISSSSSSSGLYNQETVIAQKSNFSSMNVNKFSTSQLKQINHSFIANEVDHTLNIEWQASMADYLGETFNDLTSLHFNANQADIDKAVSKYSDRLKQVVEALKTKSTVKVPVVLNKLSEMMTKAWLVPTHGHELGNKLCEELRKNGGLDWIISNWDSTDDDVKLTSARLLEQCLTTENRAHVVNNGLEKVVSMTSSFTKNPKSPDHSRISTGILEHLFKHSEGTCENVIRLGGLDTVLYECRTKDLDTLRHCASALANLSLYGGDENQEDMIKRKVPYWLFPLAFHKDDNVKYYACLAIAVLVANKEMEAAVLQSGTLNLVEPFVTSHNPSEFAKSNLSHAHGQSKHWLQRLVPVLSSKRPEARNLAAFHFCMEAGIKKSQGNTKVFHEIGAIESLRKVASCPNAIASKFAAQALKLIGEDVPHKLIQQVPLWSVEDVKQWVIQIGFSEYSNNFEQSRVDGDLLLQLTEENLKEDLGITNGIRRRRFTRELQNLKKVADYSSRDVHNLNNFLQNIGPDFTVYTYAMLNAGIDKEYLKLLSQEQLLQECGIINSIHRIRILDSIKAEMTLGNTLQDDSDKLLDVFISYRRSNGSQLASLLKVHLQVRNFSVFLDVEKLEAGKFDNNLLQSIKHASNFILVLTPNALERCLGDDECKDWIHREIVAALQSHCNIIPITDNFQWPEPEALPEDMRAICRFNGIKWVHDYQDACVEKVERFIRGEVNSRNVYQDLAITTPHGGRSVRNEVKSPNPRTQSNDNGKESDGAKDS